MFKQNNYIAAGIVVLAAVFILSLPPSAASHLKLALGSLFLPLFGLANAGLVVGQGAAFALAGAAAEVVPPSTVVALSGGIGAVIACGLALRWRGM